MTDSFGLRAFVSSVITPTVAIIFVVIATAAPPSGCASARVPVPAPVAPSLSIQSRSPSVSVDLLSSPIYFRFWARVFAVGRTLLTAGLFREAEALIAPPSPFKFPGGGGLFSSASPAKSPGGGGSLSSASPDRAPRGEGVLYLALSVSGSSSA
ncbi:hypothetical protein DY000_02057131 [Brassica cretica]|uniref:Secreted protein n=1 Tax=Brassica cretica TaxID=69181 RepID=A0ABQ7AGH8_BRACR|nr:hypothetical protein DY000_02057131 [Brassica cretica]